MQVYFEAKILKYTYAFFHCMHFYNFFPTDFKLLAYVMYVCMSLCVQISIYYISLFQRLL